jgi:phage terminase large subunit-like protein
VTTLLGAAPPGVRPPRFLVTPPAVTSAAEEAIELAASAGLILDPWQCQFLEAALGETAEGKWAAFECALIVPRQNGKGSVLEALELAGLFLFGEQLILHSSHEFKTSAEAFRRVLELIQSTPDLDRLVQKVRTSHGEEGIELRTRQRLRFVARSTGSGRGFTGDRVILDEAYNLSDRGIAALLPTMAARPNPQLIYTSSAPLDTAESEVLRRLCRRGREQSREGVSTTLAYAEFCADVDTEEGDEEAWAQANPGCPHRISFEHIAKEREALNFWSFARERLGIWDDSDDTSPQVLPAEEWAAARVPEAAIDGTPSFALDVSQDRKWAAFAAAGRSSVDDGRVAVEVVASERGTAWVVDRAVVLLERWGGELAVAKGSPAASLVPDLVAAGVPVCEVSGEDHTRACGQLFDAVTEGRIHHRGQPVLEVAVRGAGKRDVGDAWVWSRRRSAVDIAPLVAVTLAAGHHGFEPPEVDQDWDVLIV